MLHVLTVHWKDDRWVDIQLAYLRLHVPEPFRVYAFLNDLPQDHSSKFFYSSTESIRSHAVKLNLLADVAMRHASGPDDWLVFIDGDAFPIGDIAAFGTEKLRQFPLIAIQRTENHGDVQPHPSFCLTTVGFWREIAGDWRAGYEWSDADGTRVTDVGGNLLGILGQRGIDWYAMHRSNARSLHPLWFGLYEDLVYHHGAGFRDPVSRIDASLPTWIAAVTPRAVRRRLQGLRLRAGALRDAIVRRNRGLHENVFDSIRHDPHFYRQFQRRSHEP